MLFIDSIPQLLAPLFPGLIGVRIVDATPERVAAELVVRADLCTAGGILHGDAVMAFADTPGAVGTVLNLRQGKRTTTTDSSTKFIGAAKLGSTVRGECVALHRAASRPNHMVWQKSITTAEGKPCAVVMQTQLVLDA